MPYININEIDNTQYGLSQTTNNNIVYCPINAICGTYEPTLIESYDDFVKEYGNTGCVDDLSYNYAKDILLSGFPILCKRIEYGDVVDPGEGDATYAGCASSNATSGGSSGPQFTVYAKNHGTYMNKVHVASNFYWDSTAHTGTATVIVRKFENGPMLENGIFYCSLDPNTSPSEETIALDLGSQIIDAEFKYIKIINFGAENPTRVKNAECILSGGSDLSNTKTASNGIGAVTKLLLSAYAGYLSDSDTYAKYLGFLDDKYMWDVKFITAGGYTYAAGSTTGQDNTFKGMIKLCESRQDCFALLDIPKDLPQDNVRGMFQSIDTTYAAAYAPWTYNKLYNGNKAWMPPSYTFLTNLAQSVKSSPIYYPPAGVNRMTCRRTIKAEYEIGAKILNEWQPKDDSKQFINPIMRIRGSGYTVYGQRTLVNLVSPVIKTSLKSVTVRFCSIEIKKAIFNACAVLTFEQNILRTWNEFKSKVETTLLDMKKNGAINSYQIIMDRSTISESDLDNNIARGIVRCAINDALENFEIGFEISPSYVSFDEEQDALDALKMENESLS